MRFLWMPLAKLQEGLGGKTRAIVLASFVALCLVGASLYALPYPLKMEATGKVLPVARRVVFSPSVGTVTRFDVQPGQIISEGHTVALMYDANLFEKYNRLMAEMKAAETEAKSLEDQLEREVSVSEKASLRSKSVLRRADQESKQKEILELVKRNNALRDRPGYFTVLAPSMSAEEKQLAGSARWTVLTGDFKWEMENKEVKPSEPIMRLGVKEGPWEIELKIPQKHIGQILRAYKKLGPDKPLEVDFLLLSETTSKYKGMLHRDRIASEATPKTDDANDNEPYVLAYVRIEGDDIPEGYRVDMSRLTSSTDIRAKVRCGSERAGYSLFYGVWEFLYEKVWFFLF
jgi:hypothetical protein